MTVLIVGAGPVGMILAALLAQSGLHATLIDKRRTLSILPRGIAINQRTLAILEMMGVLPEVLESGIRVGRLNLFHGQTKLGDLSFEHLDIKHPYFFHVRQSDIERILANRLHGLGVKIHRDRTLVSLEQTKDLAVAGIEGLKRPLEVDLVAGCDGGQSTCSELAGIKVVRQTYGGFFQLADVVLKRSPWPLDETHYILTRGGYLMLVPAPRGETRVIASFRGTFSAPPETLDAAVFERVICERTGRAAQVERLIWATQAAFGHRLSERAVAGRVMLAGDALHQFSPIGGTNMNVGIADAEALGARPSNGLGFRAQCRD